MNPFPQPSDTHLAQPSFTASEASSNRHPQFLVPPSDEQILWFQQQQQQQQQRLREQQTAILQLFYAQQARGLGSDMGMYRAADMNMLPSPFSTPLTSFASGFAPYFNGSYMQGFPAHPSLYNNISFQYPFSQPLLQPSNQPPPVSPPNPLPLHAPNLSNNQHSKEPFQSKGSSNLTSVPSSATPAVDTRQKLFSGSTPPTTATDGFTGVDDLILAKALHEHETSREAFSSLAGTRDHSSSAWQAYYSSERSTIDKIVRALYPTKSNNMSEATYPTRHASPTMARLQGTNIPTNEPIPPTKLVPHSGGNKYTDEDDEYFTQYVLWSFSRDVEISKLAVCRDLSTRAPHHSLESWKTYWWSRDKDIERVRQLIKDGTPPTRLASFDVTSIRLPRNRSIRVASPVINRRSRPPESQNNKGFALETMASIESDLSKSDSNESYEDNQPAHTETQVSTCQNPIAYGKVDLQAVVRHMVKYPDLPSGARWDALSKLRPAHTSKAWGEYYRRNRPTIDRKVRRLVKRRTDESANPTHVTVVVEGRTAIEIQPKPESGTGHSAAQQASNHLVQNPCSPAAVLNPKAEQQPSADQPQLQYTSRPNQLHGQSHFEQQAGPTIVPEASVKVRPPVPVSHLVAKPQSQSLQGTETRVKLQAHVSQLQRQPTSCDSVKLEYQPMASLSTTQWLPGSQRPEALLGTHPLTSRPVLPRHFQLPLHHPKTDIVDQPFPANDSRSQPRAIHLSAAHPAPQSSIPSPATQIQNQQTPTPTSGSQAMSRAVPFGGTRTLDPRMTAERALLVAVKRKAAEGITERGAKRSR